MFVINGAPRVMGMEPQTQMMFRFGGDVVGSATITPPPPAPRPAPAWSAIRVARLLHRTHRRPPRLPWHPSATAAVGFFSTIAGAAYATPGGDAVAVVWRGTFTGVTRGAARIVGALALAPVATWILTRSSVGVAVVVAVEAGAIAAIGVVYALSAHRARRRWRARHRDQRPPDGAAIPLARRGHLIGLGVGAQTPHAADAMCRSIAHHADLPLYLVASTPAHVRLYRRFGFEKAGPSRYGETPMVRPPGPLPGERRCPPR